MDRDEFVKHVTAYALGEGGVGTFDELRIYAEGAYGHFKHQCEIGDLNCCDAHAFAIAYNIATDLADKRISRIAGQRTRDALMG